MARLTYKKGKPKRKQLFAGNEKQGMKMPQVIGMIPETGRSNPGQGEAKVKLRGGLKRCCVQAFL